MAQLRLWKCCGRVVVVDSDSPWSGEGPVVSNEATDLASLAEAEERPRKVSDSWSSCPL
jgi:hypothetical protein